MESVFVSQMLIFFSHLLIACISLVMNCLFCLLCFFSFLLGPYILLNFVSCLCVELFIFCHFEYFLKLRIGLSILVVSLLLTERRCASLYS